MDEATREEICAAAVRAAKAVDYEGAGTIEFIADASEGLRADRIFFMEMNTRLQVEHPVTEEITGVDLVEWQLRVASGEPIPLKQEDLSIDGHAIEVRLYAEDPASGFLPSTGQLDLLGIGEDFGRVDTGVEQGAVISPFYDPMIAKIIYHGEDRDDAIEAMWRLCGVTYAWPVKNNAWFLFRLLELDEYVDGSMTTGTIERHLDQLTAAPGLSDEAKRAIAEDLASPGIFDDDFERATGLAGFRSNAPTNTTVRLSINGASEAVDLAAASGEELLFFGNAGDAHHFYENGATFAAGPERHDAGGAASAADGAIIAPMPGKVIAVDVADGDEVTAGQRLMVLEAMKMEHALTAPFDGTVTGLEASEGGQVQVEAVLCVVEPEE